jgi:hypothetical protein
VTWRALTISPFLWALGCVMYELVTQKHAFEAGTDGQYSPLHQKHVKPPFPELYGIP